ncbi:MAG: hypothetical protein NTU54_04820 [Candidatus Omnitrophica bacterium]|nr:hypothetical protein [Candidatus Omnitrophota bacterium]
MKNDERITQTVCMLLISIFYLFPAPLFALGPDSYKIVTQAEEQEKKASAEIERPSVEYKSPGAKDPFILYTGGKKTAKILGSIEITSLPSDFTLDGIVWGGRLNQAIIKRKIVKVGDTLEDVKILDITKNGVSVFYKGRKFELSSPAAIKIEKLNKKSGGEDEK